MFKRPDNAAYRQSGGKRTTSDQEGASIGTGEIGGQPEDDEYLEKAHEAILGRRFVGAYQDRYDQHGAHVGKQCQKLRRVASRELDRGPISTATCQSPSSRTSCLNWWADG